MGQRALRSRRPRRVLALSPVLALAACSTLEYDLSPVPVPVGAKPADESDQSQPFRIEKKSILWAHGLFGSRQPDIAQLLTEEAQGHAGVADFRVSTSAVLDRRASELTRQNWSAEKYWRQCSSCRS